MEATSSCSQVWHMIWSDSNQPPLFKFTTLCGVEDVCRTRRKLSTSEWKKGKQRNSGEMIQNSEIHVYLEKYNETCRFYWAIT